MLNILLFGAPMDISRNFVQYLGNSSKSQSALVYFEFPNEKFQHPTIIKHFPEKMKIYSLQPALLQTMLAPKKEFNSASFLIWIFEWGNLDSLIEGFRYFEKIVETRKSFLPILLIGYRKKEQDQAEKSIDFLKAFKFHKLLHDSLQMIVEYFEITESKNESLFFTKLKGFLNHFMNKYSENYQITRYSSIAIEAIMKDLLEQIDLLKNRNAEIEDYISYLAQHEALIKKPITRRFLVTKFGTTSPIARNIMDYWNQRPVLGEIPSNAMEQLVNESNEMWNACAMGNCSPNFVELIKLGFHPSTIQYALRYFYENNKITTISHHIESEEFIEFANIREIIVIHEGRTLYVKSINPNTDQTLMFSDMIQAIEMIRNDYVGRLEGRPVKNTNTIEFLEFGDLKALIGNGQKGVKLILRLNNRPRNEMNMQQRTRNFLISFENQVNLLPTVEAEEQKKIRELSEKIFYRHFNPFPISIDVFKSLQVKSYLPQPLVNLCRIEQQLIEVIRSGGSMMIEDVVEEISESYNRLYSRSDILHFVMDLIEDGFIG